MFTGLIEASGSVLSLTPGEGATRLIVNAAALTGRWRTGDSIAVNGVCLTAIPVADPAQFAADLAEETLARTTLGELAAGTVVNLELPTPAGSPLGGHVVQGHVDGVATLVSIAPIHSDPAATDWRLTIELPERFAPQVISQGSITLDGISLTVAKRGLAEAEGLRIEVAIIPHTYAATNLHSLKPGAKMNVETDALAKYAAQMGTPEIDWLTTEYLLANGY